MDQVSASFLSRMPSLHHQQIEAEHTDALASRHTDALPVDPVPSHHGAWLLEKWVVLGNIPESLSQGVKKDVSKSQPFRC